MTMEPDNTYICVGGQCAPSLESFAADLRSDACGALVVFTGSVRRSSTNKERHVRAIQYEGYEKMVRRMIGDTINEARSLWPSIHGVGAWHSLGLCTLGDTGIFVGVSAPHRREAFDACSWIIDTIKIRAPIWKTELFDD